MTLPAEKIKTPTPAPSVECLQKCVKEFRPWATATFDRDARELWRCISTCRNPPTAVLVITNERKRF